MQDSKLRGINMQQVDRAVILAAGMGTRLKWLTRHRPKALMPLAGEPVILHVIRRLVMQGIREIAVNAFHHADQLSDYLGDGSRFGCHLAISDEDSLLDSGGGVKQALLKLPGNGAVLVHNCDVVADIDVLRLAQSAPVGGCALALVQNPAHHPNGDFCLQQTDITDQGDHRFTFAGVSIWDSALFEHYPADTAFSLIQPIREHIANGSCKGMLHDGYWFDVGRPTDLMRAGRSLSHRLNHSHHRNRS